MEKALGMVVVVATRLAGTQVVFVIFLFLVLELKNITALRIPGEIFAIKRRFFSFKLGFRILSRGCKTEA